MTALLARVDVPEVTLTVDSSSGGLHVIPTNKKKDADCSASIFSWGENFIKLTNSDDDGEPSPLSGLQQRGPWLWARG